MTLAKVLLAISSAAVQAQGGTDRPFAVGERAEYEVKYKFITVGSASLAVGAIDTVRGRDAYRVEFALHGTVNAIIWRYRVRDTMTSWVDTASLESLRFIQDNLEGGKERYRHFEIFPERRRYLERGRPETTSVAQPLDDLSFLLFVRTLELEVGREYSYPRYFKPESNPVRLRVLRRERVEVPAGTFATIVVQPIIKSRGLFSEGGQAQVWFSDDAERRIVKVETKLSIGSINLELKSFRSGAAVPPRARSP